MMNTYNRFSYENNTRVGTKAHQTYLDLPTTILENNLQELQINNRKSQMLFLGKTTKMIYNKCFIDIDDKNERQYKEFMTIYEKSTNKHKHVFCKFYESISLKAIFDIIKLYIKYSEVKKFHAFMNSFIPSIVYYQKYIESFFTEELYDSLQKHFTIELKGDINTTINTFYDNTDYVLKRRLRKRRYASEIFLQEVCKNNPYEFFARLSDFAIKQISMFDANVISIPDKELEINVYKKKLDKSKLFSWLKKVVKHFYVKGYRQQLCLAIHGVLHRYFTKNKEEKMILMQQILQEVLQNDEEKYKRLDPIKYHYESSERIVGLSTLIWLLKQIDSQKAEKFVLELNKCFVRQTEFANQQKMTVARFDGKKYQSFFAKVIHIIFLILALILNEKLTNKELQNDTITKKFSKQQFYNLVKDIANKVNGYEIQNDKNYRITNLEKIIAFIQERFPVKFTLTRKTITITISQINHWIEFMFENVRFDKIHNKFYIFNLMKEDIFSFSQKFKPWQNINQIEAFIYRLFSIDAIFDSNTLLHLIKTHYIREEDENEAYKLVVEFFNFGKISEFESLLKHNLPLTIPYKDKFYSYKGIKNKQYMFKLFKFAILTKILQIDNVFSSDFQRKVLAKINIETPFVDIHENEMLVSKRYQWEPNESIYYITTKYCHIDSSLYSVFGKSIYKLLSDYQQISFEKQLLENVLRF